MEEIKELVQEVKVENKKYLDQQIKEVKSEIENTSKDLKTDLEEVSKAIESLKVQKSANDVTPFYHFVKGEAAKTLSENIKKSQKGYGKQEILKAVGAVTTPNATGEANTNAAIASIAGTDVSIPELKGAWIDEFVSVSPWSDKTFKYSEWVYKEGNAAHIAEGATKPQIDMQLSDTTAVATKAAAWMELSDEAELYLPDVMAAATGILRAEVLREYTDEIINGTTNSNGILDIATALDTTDWAGAVDNANLYDIFSIAAGEVMASETNTIYSQVLPNLFLVNPKDLTSLKVAKTTDGHYVFPPQTLSSGGMNIDGIAVRAHYGIPAGTFVLGDFKKYQVKNVLDYRVETGHVNDQFIKNMFTLLGEKHYISFVKEHDKRAFVKGDIAAIKTAIETA